MSAPFFGEVFTFLQPDGTPFQVRGWGDQSRARFETLDGLPIAENPETGFYEYVAVSADGQDSATTGARADSAAPALVRDVAAAPVGLAMPGASGRVSNAPLQTRDGLLRGTTRWEERRAEARAFLNGGVGHVAGVAPAPPNRQTVGDFVGLCILIQFPDVPGTITQQEVEAFCNQTGYTGFGNNGSVYDYFYENSLGRMRYTNVVTPYYTAQHPRAYYIDESIPQPVRTWELINEALVWLKQGGFDFTSLTTDNRDFVYAINVFYTGSLVNNWARGLWPHAWHLEQPFELLPGKRANDYQITNMGFELTLGTFCHENGHMVCDFPDLYDYGSDSRGVGSYCLMCAGGSTWNTQKNPTHVGAYLKALAGWAGSITPITDGLNAVANVGDNSFFVHLKNNLEFFIVENRMQVGRDAGLADSGLAIWHVDYTGSNNHQAGTPAEHYECALIQADGRKDLESNANYGDSMDLFDANSASTFGDLTVPSSRWWDRSSSGLELHSIGAVGPQMSFSARVR